MYKRCELAVSAHHGIHCSLCQCSHGSYTSLATWQLQNTIDIDAAVYHTNVTSLQLIKQQVHCLCAACEIATVHDVSLMHQ
jgi:hypothetical protein